MHTRTVLSLAIALALALSFAPTFAAPEDPLTIVANGVQIVTSDIIIDIGQTDIIYTIPSRDPTRLPETQPPIVQPPVVIPLDGGLDAVPRVDSRPREERRPVSTPATLALENSRRKTEFRQRQATVRKAPIERDLPAFIRELTPERAASISRGQLFNRPESWLETNPPSNLPRENYSLIGLRIQKDVSSLVAFASTPENRSQKHRFIFTVDPATPTANAVPGESYGRLRVASLSLDELVSLPDRTLQAVTSITVDHPVAPLTTAVEVDAFIEGPAARSLIGSSSVGVCLIDSGLAHTLPRFSSSYVGGIDFVNNDTDPADDNDHGTAMADAILTVAPGAQFYVAKVLDASGSGYTLTVIEAIDWCMQQPVSVISMSLGGGDYDGWCDAVSLLAQKANEASERGFVVVAAAGNTPEVMSSPACGSNVLSVGATDMTDAVWSGSGLTQVTDLLAPGVAVELIGQNGIALERTGTSVSAAVVSGAAAVLVQNVSASEVPNRLRSTGVVVSSSVGNLPRIDLLRAVENTINNLSLEQTGWNSTGSESPYVKANTCGTDACSGLGDCLASSCTSDLTGTCTVSHCDTGSTFTCVYDSWSGCPGDCSTACSGNGECNAFYPAGFAASECSGGGTVCSGQNVLDESVCDGFGVCGETVQTCGGNCDSYCSSGACQNSAPGTDPYNICSSGTYCSGQNVMNGNVCGSGTACGNLVTTCLTPSQTCSGGACLVSNGYSCTVNGDCSSNVCKNNVYQGSVTSSLCVADNSYCVQGSANYTSGTTLGDSVCRGSVSGGSVWLASSGRYAVQNTSATVLAVIDKYGSMGIRGSPTWSTGTFDSGWQVNNASGSTRFSINSANGNLRAASTLTQRTTPSGTGFRVQNTTGALQGIITTTGSVALRGDFAYALTTLS